MQTEAPMALAARGERALARRLQAAKTPETMLERLQVTVSVHLHVVRWVCSKSISYRVSCCCRCCDV